MKKSFSFIQMFVVFFVIIITHHQLWGQSIRFEQEKYPQKNTSLMELPGSWLAKGQIVDQYGKAVAGATIRRTDQPGRRTFSDQEGWFVMDGVRAETIIQLVKDEYLSTTYEARQLNWFFNKENEGTTQLCLPVFDLKFIVGPDGGQFNGKVDITVPAGALDELTEISVATLPPAYRKVAEGELRPASYGSIHFEPAGLTFRKPVRVRQSSAGEFPLDSGSPGLVQLISQTDGLEIRSMPNANVIVQNNNWYYSLYHFSEYSIVDKNQMIKTENTGIEPSDLNMDGRIDEEDAERILKLEGGSQSFQYELLFKQAQTFSESKAESSGSQSETTNKAEAKATYSGISINTSAEENAKRAHELAERYGFELKIGHSESLSTGIKVGEYGERCKMIFVRYANKKFREYVRHETTNRDKKVIAEAYDKYLRSGEEWVHLKIVGESNYAVNRNLYDGMKLAVRKNDKGELEVFVQTAEYILRTLQGFRTSNCNTITQPADRETKYGIHNISVTQDSAEMYSLKYLGYFPLKEADDEHFNVECSQPTVRREISSTRQHLGFREITTASSQSTGNSQGVGIGAKIDLPGGLGVEGSASSTTTRAQTASRRNNFSSNTSTEDKSTLVYEIYKEHLEHESDHKFYRLYHLYEMYDWYYRFPREVGMSEEEKQQMRRNATNGKSRGTTKDGKEVLLSIEGDKEYWYVAGPPIRIIREAGYFLQRVAERPCVEENPPVEEPPVERPAEPTPDQGDDKSTHSDKSAKDRQTKEKMPDDESSKSPARRAGASLTWPAQPANYGISEGEELNAINEAVYLNPETYREMAIHFGGEFALGQLEELVLEAFQLSGTSKTMFGLNFGCLLRPRLEFTLDGHLFESNWSGAFPVTVFPNSTSLPPFEQEGVVKAGGSGVLLDAGLLYLFNDGHLSPYLAAGLRAQLIGDSYSGIYLAGQELDFSIDLLRNTYQPYLTSGVRWSGKRLLLQAGLRFCKWPGSDNYHTGGGLSAGWKF